MSETGTVTETRSTTKGRPDEGTPMAKADTEHVPAALFDLPLYDRAFKTFFWRGAQALGRAKSPLLGMIRSANLFRNPEDTREGLVVEIMRIFLQGLRRGRG